MRVSGPDAFVVTIPLVNFGLPKRKCYWLISAGAREGSRAVRAVPIKVITVGKSSGGAADAYADEWASKVQRYTKLELVHCKSNPKDAQNPAVAKQAEGERLLRLLKPQDFVIVMDERGKELKSTDFAQLIAQAGDEGASSIAFCIGGPYGHTQQVRDKATRSIKLSAMVLNHQVAKIMLLEQIYRAWTILNGEPYHH
ncbi:hypothetical protein WJX74_000717 [Apatococcus lobatus]|uniref:Uncharacterized protein n=2 Tax=Apatococcus TaxID=904362 RepID=A0AAW1SRS0_9CHLO